MNKHVDTEYFWKERLYRAIAFGKELHTVIYDIDIEIWNDIQSKTREILDTYIRRHPKVWDKVLDAGCGYGALYEVSIHRPHLPMDYTGVDLSPDLIQIANIKYPEAQFIVGNLASLPQFADKQFDLTVARSLKSMLNNNVDLQVWEGALKEIRRVSKNLLVIEYDIEGPGVVTHQYFKGI